MSEWWSYSLRDLLLFSPRTYYRLFELYNLELWPLQIFFLAFGAVIFIPWQRRSALAGRILALLLALCWLWVAWAYHWQRYAQINWAAHYYAPAFALEAVLLLWLGVVRNRFGFAATGTVQQRAALVLFVLAWLGYPLLAYLQGRGWAQAEVFGMAPDPTALATLAILLLCGARQLWWLFPLPVVWCVISGASLWTMEAPDFFIAPLLALLAIALALANELKSLAGKQLEQGAVQGKADAPAGERK